MNHLGSDKPIQLIEQAHQCLDRNEPEQGLALADEALALAQDVSDDALRCEAYLAAGRARLEGPTPQRGQALELLSEAIRCGESVGHMAAIAQGYRLLGRAHLELGEVEPARACMRHHHELCQEQGLAAEALAATADLADLALTMGHFEDALTEAEALEQGLRDNGPSALLARAIACRALALLHLGNVHDPLRLLEEAQHAAGPQMSAALELHLLERWVVALLFLGHFPRAAELCRRALAQAGPQGAFAVRGRLQLLSAETAWRQGDASQAIALCQAIQDEAEQDGAAMILAGARLGLARYALGTGNMEAAIALANDGLQQAVPAGYTLMQCELQLVSGEAALRGGLVEAAEVTFDEALAAATLMNSPHHRALALHGLGRSAADVQQFQTLCAEAVENLWVFLDQLSESAQHDFLGQDERRQVLADPSLEPHDPAAYQGANGQGGHQSALALHRTLGLLDEAMALVSSRLPLDELLRQLNQIVVRACQADRGLVYLLNEHGEPQLRDRIAGSDTPFAFDLGPGCEEAIAQACRTAQTLCVSDALSDPAYAALPQVESLEIRGILCIPLKVHHGQEERVLGCLYSDRQTTWDDLSQNELTLLELMAKHLSVSLEMRLLQEEASRKAQHLEMLNSLSRALAGTLDVDRLLVLALGQILEVTHGEQGYVFFGEDMPCRASLDRKGRALQEVQVSSSVVARVTKERKPIVILDIDQDQELQTKASLVVRNIRSVMCVPLILDEELIGLIYISSSTTNKTFTHQDLDLMAAIASQVALALLNSQAYATIKDLNQSLEAKVQARTAQLEAAYRELADTQDQLVQTEKLATIGTLAGGVAHEINNPLGAILTNAQLLRMDIDDPEQVDSLMLIEEGARRCKEITEALLKYSNLARNRLEPVELNEVTQDVLTQFEPQFQQAGIEVEYNLGLVPSILGDTKELRQVLSNLLANALDAIQERHGQTGGLLRLRLERVLKGVHLTVEDNGAGMEPGVIKRVFDPFFTTKAIGSGTGLGLSVCQRIIERHNGQILLHSKVGEGAAITVELPVP